MYRKNWKNRREEKTKQNFSRRCMPKYHHLQIWMHQGYTRAGVTHFSRHSIIAKSICSSVNTATYDDEPAMWRHQTQQLPWKRQMVKKGGETFTCASSSSRNGRLKQTTRHNFLPISWLAHFPRKKFGFIFISFSFDEGNNNENRLHSQDI